MNKFFKKYGFYIGVGLLCLIVIIIFSLVLNNTRYDDSAISVEYDDDNVISVVNVLPMTDRIGKLIGTEANDAGITGYVEFEVKSLVDGKVDYEVYLVKNDVENEVPVKFIKVYLTDENETELINFEKTNLPTYYELKVSDIAPDGKIIYEGSLKNKKSMKFKLRMWVADTYEITAEEKSFSAEVYVRVK